MNSDQKKTVLVTGGAGFVGNHVALRLLEEGHEVVVVDNVNSYYDPALKEARLARLPETVPVYRVDITDRDALAAVFVEHAFDVVCHLAAQAGVRYSLEAPEAYVSTNYTGTFHIFELAKQHGVSQVVFASTSSVYGESTDMPFREDNSADTPLSLYAATKRGCELMGFNYHHLFGLNVTCLRFFTVYGPWGRPDMALFKFVRAIEAGEPIDVYNNGHMKRDFTYIDDIVDGFTRAVARPLGYEIINLGHGEPLHLMDFIRELERQLGSEATINYMPLQPGDVPETYASTEKARDLLGFTAQVGVPEGIKNFVEWYREYTGRA